MNKIWCLLALLAALALSACGGGGGGTPAPPGTPSPAITAISPLTGQSGDQVTFTATTSGSTITIWDWDFAGGANPNSANRGPQVTVTLGNPGTYVCQVDGENQWFGTTTYFTLIVTP
jgi:PKD repeat protein